MADYEVVTIDLTAGAAPRALPRIEAYMGSGSVHGTLRACWHSDIGALNQIMVIREFTDDAARLAERQRLATVGNAFDIGEYTTGMRVDTFRMFDFLPPLGAGAFGPFYEVRAYTVRATGLGATLAAWKAAVPERITRSPLTAAMYAVDGLMPRFMHVWPYPSLDARAAIRAKAVADGVWPPKGGPDHLLVMQNSIFVAAAFSPLR